MIVIPREHKFYDTNEQRSLLMELRELGIDIPTYSVYEIEETPEILPTRIRRNCSRQNKHRKMLKKENLELFFIRGGIKHGQTPGLT